MSSVRKMTETRVQDFANKRVLLVDDHTHIRAIFTSILNGLGMFRLSTADRSDRALSTLEAEPIDLNWRGLLAAPGLKPADRQALLDAVDKARSSQAWQDILKQNNWQDSYLAGQSFSRFIAEDSTNTQRLLARMGLAQGGGAGMPVDAYFFPTLVGSIMLAALLLLLTPRVLRMLPRPQPAIAGTQIKLAASEEVSLQPDLKRFATAVATLLAYVAGLKFFGFLITTPLFFFVFCRLMRSKAWLRDAVVSILTTGAVFYLFQSLLGVQLP
eukprot:gene13104-17563_t